MAKAKVYCAMTYLVCQVVREKKDYGYCLGGDKEREISQWAQNLNLVREKKKHT